MSKKIDIDLVEVGRMAGLGARLKTIADALGVCTRTIRRRCKKIILKARARHKIKLLELQMAACEKGVPAALIWSGKQYLGQRDVPLEKSPATSKTPPVLQIVRAPAPVETGT